MNSPTPLPDPAALTFVQQNQLVTLNENDDLTSLENDERPLLENPEDDLFWYYSGKLDLSRRFFLSAIKSVNIFNLCLAILRGLYLLDEELYIGTAFQVSTILIFAMGGLVEPILSLSISRNKQYLPIWNGIINVFENFFLKIINTGLLLCPVMQLPNEKHSVLLPQKSCVYDENIIIIGALCPFLFMLSLFTGVMEFSRYKSAVLYNDKVTPSRLNNIKNYFRASTFLNCLLFSANAMLSCMGLIAGINFFVLFQINKPITREYTLPFSFVAGLMAAIIEYHERQYKRSTPSNRKKAAFLMTEFLRPSLSNLFGLNYLFSAFIALTVTEDAYDNNLALAISTGVIAVITSIVMNTLRARDSYKYEFRAIKTANIASENVTLETPLLSPVDVNNQYHTLAVTPIP